jgi:hypothetical protein
MRIFGDESCVTSNDGEYLVIGALSCDKETAKDIRKKIYELNRIKGKTSEYHFTDVGNKRGNTKNYQDFLDIFIAAYKQKRTYQTGLEEKRYYRHLCFDALLIEHDKIDHSQFSDGDHQMGFFRFYYTLLETVIKKHYHNQDNVVITIDKIDLKKPELIINLKERLDTIVVIDSLNPQDSTDEPLLQLADVITGMISFKWNRWEKSEMFPSVRNQAKKEVVEYFEANSGISLKTTTFHAKSFNIWQLKLK